jgi:acyl CoA:acetate/3-ketoacid CoA transferase alpha subunit
VPANKVTALDTAASRIESGMALAIGGFLGQRAPFTLIRTLRDRDVSDLTIYANDAGFGDAGIVELVLAGKVKTLYCCHAGRDGRGGERHARARVRMTVSAASWARRPGRMPSLPGAYCRSPRKTS